MITRYRVYIFKEEECDECNNRLIKEPIFMHGIPDKETAKEIATLLEQRLKK